jgi:hypothetical protein
MAIRQENVQERVMNDRHDRSEAEGIPADVQARFLLIEERIARPLTDAQAEQVQKQIARSIALGVTLRSYPLTNADEPEIALDPFVGGAR